MSAPLLSTDSVNVIQDSTENDPTLKDVSSRTKRDFVATSLLRKIFNGASALCNSK